MLPMMTCTPFQDKLICSINKSTEENRLHWSPRWGWPHTIFLCILCFSHLIIPVAFSSFSLSLREWMQCEYELRVLVWLRCWALREERRVRNAKVNGSPSLRGTSSASSERNGMQLRALVSLRRCILPFPKFVLFCEERVTVSADLWNFRACNTEKCPVQRKTKGWYFRLGYKGVW